MDHIPNTRMLVPKHIHPHQAIDAIREAFSYLDNAIYNGHSITLSTSVVHIAEPKAFYVYAWHLQILDRVLYRMEKHLRDLYSPQDIKKKHVAIYQLSKALQWRYLKVLACIVLVRSQEVYECLIDDKDDEEISWKLYNCLKETKEAAEILISLLRDCLEKDKDSEETSHNLNKSLTKAESAKEMLWYPNKYLKEVDDRVVLSKLCECLETIADVEVLLTLQQDVLLERQQKRQQDELLELQRGDHRIYQQDDPRGYGLRQNRSRELGSEELDICLKKTTYALELLWKLWLYFQYNDESGKISQGLSQCHQRAKDAGEMLSELRLENGKYGDKVSQKLNKCLQKIKDTGNILRKSCEYLKKDNNSGEIEDALCICLSKVRNGRKILQELNRCFEMEKDNEKILRELYGCLEQNADSDDGEHGKEISQTLSECLEKTKDAGDMLLEVLHDSFEEKQGAKDMLPELVHDDDRKHRRGGKISQKLASQKLNQKLNKCLERVKDAGEMLRELCECLKKVDGGEIEDDVNYLLGKIFMASITCSPDEDVKVLRDTFIRINLLKPSQEENSGKLSAKMTTGSVSFVESSCATASLLFNSDSIDTNCRISRPFPDSLHNGDPQVCSVYRLGCKKHFCALPTGHTRLHEFSGPCNANCNLNWDFSTDSRLPGLFPQRLNRENLKISSTDQLGCKEARCILPLGHTSPHKFLSRCSAGCILSSDHSGSHLFPHTLSIEADRMHKQAIRMAAVAMHLVDKVVCTSLLDQGTTSAISQRALAGQFSDEDKKAMMDKAARSGWIIVRSRKRGMYIHVDEEEAELILQEVAAFGATQHTDWIQALYWDQELYWDQAQYWDQLLPLIQRKLFATNAKAKWPSKPAIKRAIREVLKVINGPYSNLDISKKQIRLFKLYPGTDALKIEGSFHCVEFSTHEYIALSYTWGNETPCRTIQVNGQEMIIRENLWWFLGLQSISISEAKFFWIDAICINQSNVKERNHQVGFMSQIYTNVSAVYIWLGRESDDSDLAMEYITRQESKELKTKGMGYRPLWSKQEGRALVELCERPYWRRMWIIQEVISARNIITFCGTKSFDWGCLMKLYHKLKVLESTNWLAHHPFALAVFQSSASVIIWQRAYWRHSSIPKPSLKKLISVFSGWQCTDLRDKVYALVGTASPETTVVPDYSRSTYQICQDIWKKDKYKDAQYHDMVVRVLEHSGDPMEPEKHSPQ